jgi:hypothetical protein
VASSSVGRLRITFQTSFVRGRRFRFEYGGEHDRQIIWSDGVHTYTHWALAKRIGRAEVIDDGADIAGAIAAATGTSSGTAVTVPAMLLPVSIGAACSWLGELGELSLDGDEQIASRSCARVNGRALGTDLVTLWIDRDTYLLRRVITSRGLWNETTTSYEPSLDLIDIRDIECPDVETTPPQPRGPVLWTGIRVAMRSRQVESIDEGSPAMRSGLAIGDEIEVVNGQSTDRAIDVLRAMHAVKVGEHLALTIRRGGTTLDVLVLVVAHPSRATAIPSGPLVD